MYKELSEHELEMINGGLSWDVVVTIILSAGDFLMGFYNGWQKAKEEHSF